MHRVSTGRLILQIIIVATSVMNEVVLVNLDFSLFAKRWLHGPGRNIRYTPTAETASGGGSFCPKTTYDFSISCHCNVSFISCQI